jgi:hypothetical protein
MADFHRRNLVFFGSGPERNVLNIALFFLFLCFNPILPDAIPQNAEKTPLTSLSNAAAGQSAVFSATAIGSENRGFLNNLARAALGRTRSEIRVTYNPSYRKLRMPLGDVPASQGVCTDLVIRSYRLLGIDLQSRVNEDMNSAFTEYPSKWGLKKPDSNIDHRRVPNLEVFFRRKGSEMKITSRGQDYLPGDIVTWTLPGGLPHIGIVTGEKAATHRYLIAHNIGGGPELEDFLFQCPINGHFRYAPPLSPARRISLKGVSNLHSVSDTLYRSGQPDSTGMKALAEMGIRTIVNLRAFHNDDDEAMGLKMELAHIRVQAWAPSREELVRFLRIAVDSSKWPVLVHCQHGSDRTGSFVAAYRMIVQGWSAEDAVNEMTNGGFGFHRIFINLIPWLSELDVAGIRKELAL